MKLCQFRYIEKIYWGIVKDDLVFPIENFNNLAEQENQIKLTDSFDITNVNLLPPTRPSKIVCIGRNYAEHAAELGNAVPKEPLLFLKAPSSVITEGERIIIPEQSNQVEHEGELGMVIGRTCRNLSDDVNPLEIIFGYICLNDVTARDLQRADVQFTRAKSFDTFCPIGAFIETDLDITDLRVTTKVNGIIKQDGRTSQMMFSIPFLIKYISRQMTLNPGDILATGTPSGVSKLNKGDICEVEIEGIGILKNPVT
jgi:2-keto-4-pentenoate hydratase/2-oxohepta-3-ene-1,7-dioic acid hydratase in catechol pathway